MGESPRRIGLYWGVLVLTGPLIVVGLELGLRLLPGLAPEPLISRLATANGQTLYSVNSRFAERFFFERYQGRIAAQGRMLPQPFVEAEAKQPYRIVFVGASTVQGFPHPGRLAAASFLEAMLEDVAADREVQVFNLGITAIASFAVARTLEEALELEPDLAIVYTGHNEFYGIYGGAQQRHSFSNYWHYHLLQLRLGRLLRQGLDWFRAQEQAAESLLAIRSARGQFPYGSEPRQQAEVQLRRNLQTMATLCQERGVPLVLCTLASNNAGFAPVASSATRSRDEDARLTAISERLAGSEAPAEDVRKSLDELQQISAKLGQDAWLWYLRARALRHLERSDEAAQAFLQARDFDAMPWRAPGQHNRIIRQVATEHGLLLADIESAFEKAGSAAGVGWNLMADHVHPSVAGQELLARTLLLAIKEQLGPVHMGQLRSAAEYRAMLGDLPAEQAHVDQSMTGLLGEAPMDRYNGHNFSRFKQRTTERLQRLEKAEVAGLKRWRQRSAEIPLVLEVADQLYAAQDFERAQLYYEASRREAPFTPRGDLWAVVQLAWIQQLLGQAFSPVQQQSMRQALARAEFLLQAPEINASFIDFIQGQLHYFLGQSGPALVHLERAFLDQQFRRPFLFTLFPPLATELVRAGRREDAQRYAREASAESRGNPYFVQYVDQLAP